MPTVPKLELRGMAGESEMTGSLYWIYRKLGVNFAGRYYGKMVGRWPRISNLLPMSDGWKVREVSETRITVAKGETVMELDHDHGLLLITQIQGWKAMYLPTFPVEGKTILDIGAGGGETCALFFERGAAKVIAVEPDTMCVADLEANAIRNKWKVQVIHSPLRAEHLSLPHDFCKMDCEGGEVELLKVNNAGPLVVQLHPAAMSKDEYHALIKKLQLRCIGDRIWTNCGG